MALTPGKLAKTIATPSGGYVPLGDATPVGWADFADSATAGTPINIPSGGAATTLTNNKSGGYTQTAYLPDGVTTAFWNSGTNAFSFAELSVGDMVEIRVDVTITTTVANQEIDLTLSMAQGGTTPFSIPLGSVKQFKTAGAHRIVESTWFYIGAADVRNNPAQIKASSPDAATAVVQGWAVKITRR